MKSFFKIKIDLSNIDPGLCLTINTTKPDTLFIADDSALNNEATYQLVEGFFYDFEFSKPDFYFQADQIIRPHARNEYLGTIAPNIYVGTLSLPVYHQNEEAGVVELEVQSKKSKYRQDYRDMLEFITEKCTELLMQSNSPVSHYFETDFTKDTNPQARYQKFSFIKSILSTDEFAESVHRVVSAPVTQWKETEEQRDIRKAARFRGRNINNLLAAGIELNCPAIIF